MTEAYKVSDIRARPDVEVTELDKVVQSQSEESAVVEELKFVPYYFRANRRGRGHARVGLKRWHR